MSSLTGTIANPITNPMMMNPYMMGYGMTGIGMQSQGGLGMMIPGFSMYPYANPYMSYKGPYGPMNPYNYGDRKLNGVEDLDEKLKID